MDGTFLFLGTGASAGVPVIGCSCSVCSSKNSRDKRLRPSGLISVNGKSLLVDVGPDFRRQALDHKITHLDGMLLTHTHYDHIAGIDELRVLNYRQKKSFPCLLSNASYRDLKTRYYYLFEENPEGEYRAAQLDCHILPSDYGKVDFLGISVDYVSYSQADMQINGFRIGNFAYISDIREYDEKIFSSLRGVKTLVLSALRQEPSRVHLTLDEAVAFAHKVGAAQTWLTHISHAVDHDAAGKLLPPSVQPGYDGLSFTFKADTHA